MIIVDESDFISEENEKNSAGETNKGKQICTVNTTKRNERGQRE